MRYRADLDRGQPAADLAHLAERIIVPTPRPPGVELPGQVGGGLTTERRIARTDTFPGNAMTLCTGPKPARGIAMQIERGAFRVLRVLHLRPLEIQPGIIGRDARPRLAIQPPHDRAHQGMFAPAVRIIVELAVDIARIEPREPRGRAAITLTAQAMAPHAGRGRAGIAATERDHLAGGGKQVFLRRLRRTGHDSHGCKQRKNQGAQHRITEPFALRTGSPCVTITERVALRRGAILTGLMAREGAPHMRAIR